ncbi:protein LKAAEAR1-like isoform X2 [Scyliorhinus torazame]|uniref:protein LKAAEAR1-like isoform X2 n=1 Tax=Scyliorhinus torazame TaxID=75743 RepID=UPI003B5B24FA
MSEKKIKTMSQIEIKVEEDQTTTISPQPVPKGSQKDAPNSQQYPKIGDFITSRPDAPLDCNQQLERKKQQNLIGQLKAAESHNKIHSMKLRYRKMRPTARKAIRLEAFLPPWHEKINLKDPLEKLERKRVEEIMSDEAGLTINRIL